MIFVKLFYNTYGVVININQESYSFLQETFLLHNLGHQNMTILTPNLYQAFVTDDYAHCCCYNQSITSLDFDVSRILHTTLIGSPIVNLYLQSYTHNHRIVDRLSWFSSLPIYILSLKTLLFFVFVLFRMG